MLHEYSALISERATREARAKTMRILKSKADIDLKLGTNVYRHPVSDQYANTLGINKQGRVQ